MLTEVRALLTKEMRQARRSRGALVSTIVLSALLMVVTPMGQLAGLLTGLGAAPLTSGLGGLSLGQNGDDPLAVFGGMLMPLFITMAGLLVPSIAAVHTVVVERERRSVELLIALPVRVRDILIAKLVATLALCSAVLVPLLLLDIVALLYFAVVTPAQALELLAVLIAAELCSIALALLVALLARDFRTANNLNGVTIGPALLLVGGVVFVAPAALRIPLLVLLLLSVGAGAIMIALRWLTFERYLA
jgi:ABC-type Na+ efflux pump permease subunit